MASNIGSNVIESWRFSPLTTIANGTPRASTTRCRFVPGFPDRLGLGRFPAPPGGWLRSRHRGLLVPNRFDRARASDEASLHAVCPGHQPLASHVVAANTSSRCRSRVPAEGLPKGCRSGAHTGCRLAQRGHRPNDADLPCANARTPESAAATPPTIHCRSFLLPCAQRCGLANIASICVSRSWHRSEAISRQERRWRIAYGQLRTAPLAVLMVPTERVGRMTDGIVSK
ncbi:hypothetical protein BPA30113_02980 [Burkholderia paludis]|uniref:Uncharacterized protein n=1 Tax=Burkholderia paludis TaxID=1506587 RepID=A0A6J5DH96_9BURK|nr:hypothetical protein LMG30113_01934 [Burkholderia paludis]VWB66616.1 hypothetical protein BPA30113_02980 [Burkholderia paludis]